MSITQINATTDVINPNAAIDLNRLSPVELMDHIELDNAMYYFERLKRQDKRNKIHNKTLVNILHRVLLSAI